MWPCDRVLCVFVYGGGGAWRVGGGGRGGFMDLLEIKWEFWTHLPEKCTHALAQICLHATAYCMGPPSLALLGFWGRNCCLHFSAVLFRTSLHKWFMLYSVFSYKLCKGSSAKALYSYNKIGIAWPLQHSIYIITLACCFANICVNYRPALT